MSLCRTLGQDDHSKPSFLFTLLCCHPRFAKLWVDWRKGSPTRLSPEQKDTQSMSPSTARSTPPWGGSSQYALAHTDTHSSSPRGVTHHLSYAVCSAFNSHLESIKAVNQEVGWTVFLKFLSHSSLQWRCVRLLGSCFMHRKKQWWWLLSEHNKISWCPHELARDAEGNEYSTISVAQLISLRLTSQDTLMLFSVLGLGFSGQHWVVLHLLHLPESSGHYIKQNSH